MAIAAHQVMKKASMNSSEPMILLMMRKLIIC